MHIPSKSSNNKLRTEFGHGMAKVGSIFHYFVVEIQKTTQTYKQSCIQAKRKCNINNQYMQLRQMRLLGAIEDQLCSSTLHNSLPQRCIHYIHGLSSPITTYHQFTKPKNRNPLLKWVTRTYTCVRQRQRQRTTILLKPTYISHCTIKLQEPRFQQSIKMNVF